LRPPPRCNNRLDETMSTTRMQIKWLALFP
jgi:hypothetical protein